MMNRANENFSLHYYAKQLLVESKRRNKCVATVAEVANHLIRITDMCVPVFSRYLVTAVCYSNPLYLILLYLSLFACSRSVTQMALSQREPQLFSLLLFICCWKLILMCKTKYKPSTSCMYLAINILV